MAKNRCRALSRVIAACAVSMALALGAGPVGAAIVNFSATVDGPQEPTPSLAVWSGTFVMTPTPTL